MFQEKLNENECDLAVLGELFEVQRKLKTYESATQRQDPLLVIHSGWD